MRLAIVLLGLTGSAWAGNVVPDYGDVRLTGPFGERMDAMIRNHVERTDVELLTACFGERNETRKIWQCEFWGKYMHAAAPFATYTKSAALREKLDVGAARVIAAQSPDGYIGNYPDELRFGNRGWDVWGVKYTLMGLLHHYDATGDEKSLAAAKRLVDFMIGHFTGGRDVLPMRYTGCFGGLPSCSSLEPVVWLYRRTGERRYLDFASYIVRELTEFADGPQLLKLAKVPVGDRRLEVVPECRSQIAKDRLEHQLLKAYEMMSCHQGLLDYYEVTGDRRYLDATLATAESIVRDELYVTGGCTAGECWHHGREHQNEPITWMQETCVVTTWMRLCEKLLTVTGDPKWADYLERAFYNVYLAALNRDCSAFAAYTPVNGDRSTGHHHCRMHTNCCNANGPRGFLTVLRGLAQAKGADVFLNFYVSGSFKVKVPDLNEKVAFRTYSRYPKDGDVQIRYVDAKARKFALNLRIPETWAKVRLELNGETRDVATTGYLRLDRTWKPGDWITLTFEQPVAKHVLNNAVAFTRGPLLLVRASRFADGDIASPIDVAKVDAKALSSFVRVQSDDPTLYALFSANLPIGLHTSDPDNGNLLRSARFCDYASAANAWTPTDYCRSWIPVAVHGKTF